MRCVLSACCLVVLVVSDGAQQQPQDRFTKVADRLVAAINAENWEAIEKEFDPGMREFLPLDKTTAFFKEMLAAYGKIKKLESRKPLGNSAVTFIVRFEKTKLQMLLSLDERDQVDGLQFLPLPADIPVPERNSVVLSLPFKGSWMVCWGGDTGKLNQHHDVPNQRFAFDFLVADEKGSPRRGEGTSNEDFYAFGREVLAPADGVVTDVIQGVRDNVPGSMNPYSALGNAVFVQHGKLEVSVLAHLKLGSIKVKVGDKVAKGQVLGLCGNSGNSSEPHLHYHLQNTPVIQDGTGIKCFFEEVTLTAKDDRTSKQDYSPVKGDVVTAD